jgi:voltage-dependent potassium channel beta subunit
MHYRRLGKSGLKVSEIALGSWITFGNQLDENQSSQLIHSAFDHGVNFFDCADVYAKGLAETMLGKAIQDLPREELVISSKVFQPVSSSPNGRGLSRKHVTEAIHNSLSRMQLDYLDLYFCQRYDPDTPIEEVVRTMNDLIHQGKILYWGTSEWEPARIMEAHGVARQYGLIPPAMEQPQYNLFHRKRVEVDLLPVCQEIGLGLTTYSPLFFGILSGKYNDGIPDSSRTNLPDYKWVADQIDPEKIGIVRQLTMLATQLGITTAQLAIGWLLRLRHVSSVITGATKLEQLDENLFAAAALEKLDNDILEQIDHIVGNAPE